MKGNRAIVTAVVVVVVLLLGWYLIRRSSSSRGDRSRWPSSIRRPRSRSPAAFPVIEATLGDETKKAIAPPGLAGTRLTWKVRVPDDGWLRVNLGLKPEVWEKPGDGVLFMVLVSDGKASDQLFTQHVDPFNKPADRRWIPVMVDLSAYGGEQVDLIFNTYASPPQGARQHGQRPAALGRPRDRHSMTPKAAAGVPLLDLQAQYAPIRDEILAAITRVCDSQRFILGPEVDALERELVGQLEAGDAIAVSSGTDALLAAMMALGIGPGDEVITTDVLVLRDRRVHQPARRDAACSWTSIRSRYNLDAGRRRAPRSRRRRGRSSPVHLYGLCADMDPILGRRARRRRAGDRGRGAGHRRAVPRPAGRLDGRGRLLLVLSEQEPRRVRRRRAGHDRRRRAGARGPAAAQSRRGAQVHPSAHRRQLPAGRAAGRGAAGQAAAPGRAGRRCAAPTPRATPSCSARPGWTDRVGAAGRGCRAARTSTTSSSSGCPSAIASARTSPSAASAPRSTTRCRSTCSPASRTWAMRAGDFPHAERAAAETLALPIYGELTRRSAGEGRRGARRMRSKG